MKQLITLLIFLLFVGCVPESKYEEVVKENNRLKSEIYELKFGVSKLSKDAKKMFNMGDFAGAKEKITILIDKHPNSVECAEARKIIPIIEEELLWDKVENSNDLDLVKEYIRIYPQGRYVKKPMTLKEI
ncbi:MAG: hypothetical protein ACK5L5_09335 [Bacteroidales bacterium]